MVGADVKLHVDKLTTDTWATWKFQVRLYLNANKLLNIVTGAEVRPGEDQPEARAAWDDKEAKAMAALGLTVDRSLVYIISETETSAETWTVLHEHFQKSNSASMYHLLATLFKLDMKEGSSAQAHLKSFSELLQKIQAVQVLLPEPVKMCALLESLPPSYAMLRTSLQSRGDALTLAEIREALVAEEHQRQSKKSAQGATETALRVGGRGGFRGRGASRGGGGGRPPPVGSQGARGAFKGICYNCGIEGHRSVECWKPRKPKHEAANAVNDDNSFLFITSEQEEECSSAIDSTKRAAEDWIVDSGATSHMTANASCLVDYQPYTDKRTVKLGDGRRVSAIGVGTALLNLKTDAARLVTFKLKNTMLVPDLACSLFSVIAASDTGKSVNFKHGRCLIQDEADVTIAEAHRRGKLFYLKISGQPHKHTKREETALPVTDKVSFKILHQRLGHVHEQKLRRLIKEGTIPGDATAKLCITLQGLHGGEVHPSPLQNESRTREDDEALGARAHRRLRPNAGAVSRWQEVSADLHRRLHSSCQSLLSRDQGRRPRALQTVQGCRREGSGTTYQDSAFGRQW